MSTLVDKAATAMVYTTGWQCGGCNDFHDGPIPEGSRYYNTEDLVDEIRNNSPVRVDYLEHLARSSVVEVTLVEAPCGPVDEEDAHDATGYVCPQCGEVSEYSHEARDCCLVHNLHEPEEDTCLFTCSIDSTSVENGWSFCFCDAEGSNACMVKVCLTCHAEINRIEEMHQHVQNHREEASYDEEVNVGKPASLPPAYEYVEQEPDPGTPVPSCTMCNGQFCCTVHDVHKSPHRGHAG